MTIKTHEIQNILQMACLKATGFYLPDMGEDENKWKFKLMDGKKVGVLPKLNPRTIISFSQNNSIPQIICRSMIVNVFKEAKTYALSELKVIDDWNELVKNNEDWFNTYAHRIGDRDSPMKVELKKYSGVVEYSDITNLGYWNGVANKYNSNIKYYIDGWYKSKGSPTSKPTDYNKVKKTLRYDSDIMGEGIEALVNKMNPMGGGYKVKANKKLKDACGHEGFHYPTTGIIQDSLTNGYIRDLKIGDKGCEVYYNQVIKMYPQDTKQFYTKKQEFRKSMTGEDWLMRRCVERAIKLSNGAYDSFHNSADQHTFTMGEADVDRVRSYKSVANTRWDNNGGNYYNRWWYYLTTDIQIKTPPEWNTGNKYYYDDDFKKPNKQAIMEYFKNTKRYVADIDYKEQMRIFGVGVEPNVESQLIKYYC